MSHTLSIQQAAGQLAELVRSLGPEDEIVLTQNDQPVARIVPSVPAVQRKPGTLKGTLTVVGEDDEHLKDFKDYMPLGRCWIPMHFFGTSWMILRSAKPQGT